MINPGEYYKEQLDHWSDVLKALKQQSLLISSARLFVFILTVGLIWIFWGQLLPITVSLFGGIAIFLFLVSQATNISRRQQYAHNQAKIQKDELLALRNEFSPFQTGEEFLHEMHPYNQDIDVFGEGSLFPRIDRCETSAGRACLANQLNSNNTQDVEQKQILVRELSSKVKWRQNFKASAKMIRSDLSSDGVIKWMTNHNSFLPGYAKWLSIPFTLFSLGLIITYALEIIPYTWLLAGFFLGLAITGPYIRKISRFYNDAANVKEILAQYSILLEAIEREEFIAEKLQNTKQLVVTDGKKASAQLRELAKLIDYLGNRNNMLFGPVANGFMLWDLYFTSRIDHWFAAHNISVEDWFSAIESFDAWNSLGNFAFNHPEYTFPQLAENDTIIEATRLAHPLIHSSKVVTNDFSLSNGQFYIITGANMAGKSTFLRTVSLSIVMANCGLPVSAHSFTYKPIPLISSMRTSDSLKNEESYFFSELKRLKYVIDTIKEYPYFVVLDEILKGTNSQDKAEGSKKFMERLLGTSSMGIIATHDLSLCTLENTHPKIQNRHFDAEIIEDELFFDYRLKEGVCKNMNASFLLKKMDII